MIPSNSFHNVTDVRVRAFQSYANKWKGASNLFLTIRNRSLEYQFFPHFHPYVTPLIQRLNDAGGIDELQEADTIYRPKSPPASNWWVYRPLPADPQPVMVLPDSTRAVLATEVTVTNPVDKSPLILSAGTTLTLAHGTTVTFPKSTQLLKPDGSIVQLGSATGVTLPGDLPIISLGGNETTFPGLPGIVPDYTEVTLPNGAPGAVLTGDGFAVDLPGKTPGTDGTSVLLRSALPRPLFYEEIFDPTHYNPTAAVQYPRPVKDLDFTYDGAYSIYNWELFFHAPLLIAVHLSQNQKFADAQKWFHYIFNPTDNSAGPTPQRFWKVLPFQSTDVQMIQEILVNLSTQQDKELFNQTVSSIANWKDHPFQPFAVGKYRPTAYMLKTVMAYLDNLIAWGDSLFQMYTIETINEATQLYVLAANILGPKPQAVPAKGNVKPLTYNDLRGKGLDDFSNTLVEMEVDIPFDSAPLPASGSNPVGIQILAGIGKTLYFCVPRNDQLLAYWDTVADRLFKIHNSLNLQGVFQLLPLYDPPIEPALLVRASAAGLDVSAVVSGLNQPLPLVRFQLLVSKAAEICQEVKSLGANILAAMEKQDNESLALMRAQHENTILNMANAVKYSQWQDATKARQGAEQSLANAVQRYTYYQKLLGRQDGDIQIPQLDVLDQGSLQSSKFSQLDASSEPQMAWDPINVDIAQNSLSVSDGDVKSISVHESEELNKLESAQSYQAAAQAIDLEGSTLSMMPQFDANAEPMGAGLTTGFGGVQLHAVYSLLSSVSRATAEGLSYEANRSAKLGSYSNREREYTFQSNSAKGEINQIFKQLRGAQIREAIAQFEYNNHQQQMHQARDIVDFLQGNGPASPFEVKETTAGFYAWMKREVKALHAKAFQLAFEVAKKAERAMQNELGNPDLSYIQYGYLDGTEGLLAGEKLLFDIKAMEMAYHDFNQREYELTKHVSLLQVAPLSLVQLRATGTCMFTVPEELFDMDGGHYFRRIKSVALSIPCVVGPYTSINCTLTLEKSSIRTSTSLPNGKYARQGSDDGRFNDYYGSLQSIVASSGQSDSGVFETNLRDERYLPFEGAGIAGSQWQLTLPSELRQFDFDTISDVILHVRYTAREGGNLLRAAAVQNLQSLIVKGQTVGSVRLFSIRHEFPTEWAKFRTASKTPTAGLSLTLQPEHFPFWAKEWLQKGSITALALFAEDSNVTINVYDTPDKPPSGNADVLARNPALGKLLSGHLVKIGAPKNKNIQDITDFSMAPRQALNLYFEDNSMRDLWLAVTWKGFMPQ